MARTKGTDVIALRAELRQRGGELERGVRERLSPAALDVYDRALAVSWSPVETQMEVYQTAARALFPSSPEPMAELGRALARRTYSGVYKVFLRIPSIGFILARAAALWESFYDTGTASVERVSDHEADVVVRGFPDLPAPMREMACGHMTVLLERAGVRGPAVRAGGTPEAWRWHASWR